LNITEMITMLSRPQIVPYHFFNLGALIGTVGTLAFIAFCMLYFPALLALPMGLGWLGLVGSISVGAVMLANNYRQTRGASNASALGFGLVVFAAGAFALHIAPVYVTTRLSILAVSMIGCVLGSGIYECVKSGWRNFFSSASQLMPVSPIPQATASRRMSSTHQVIFELGPMEGYSLDLKDNYDEIFSPDGVDNSDDETVLVGSPLKSDESELKLERSAPHAGARLSKLLHKTTPRTAMIEGDDGVLTYDSNDSTVTAGSSSQRPVR
jgi:hypothetical protein